MRSNLTITLPLRLRLRRKLDEPKERPAIRAALNAAHLLGLAAGRHLRQLRASHDPLLDLKARLDEAQLQARLAWQIVEIISRRLAKITERRRPYYSPADRYSILEIRNLLGWSRDTVAQVFLVSPNTIFNWDGSADSTTETVGSLVKPVPPITRFNDSVRALVQLMLRLGVGGQDLIALTLARAGWKLAPRSVARIAQEKPRAPAVSPSRPGPPRTPVIARFLHHVWMMDVSEIQGFLGNSFYLAAVFDAFSRVPLALQLLDRKPHASEMAQLFKNAVRSLGRPKYLVTDLGGEFTATIFRSAVARLGAIQRFASKENLYATARLERFWRTLKQTASLRLLRPLTIEDLERRLETAHTHYLCFRPHQGLDSATPAEALLGVQPASKRAVSPPRGRPGEGSAAPPFAVVFLAPERAALPVLVAA